AHVHARAGAGDGRRVLASAVLHHRRPGVGDERRGVRLPQLHSHGPRAARGPHPRSGALQRGRLRRGAVEGRAPADHLPAARERHLRCRRRRARGPAGHARLRCHLRPGGAGGPQRAPEPERGGAGGAPARRPLPRRGGDRRLGLDRHGSVAAAVRVPAHLRGGVEPLLLGAARLVELGHRSAGHRADHAGRGPGPAPGVRHRLGDPREGTVNARVGNGPRKKAQRALALLAVGLLAAALSACTGTKEPQPPTLLVVGVEDRSAPPAVPQLLLVEDVTATAPVGDPRLRVVPGSRRALLAPAVAIDFEERDGARDAAWVLTREVDASGPTPVVTAHLQRFEVADVDPAAPTAFAEDAAALVTLTDPGGTGVLDGVSDSSPATCPTALQVSRSGAHAVILDDPEACGLTDHPELWLVDTASGDAMTLEGTNDVLPLPPYANQSPSNERVYFLVAGIGSAHVYQDAFDGASSRVQTLAFGTDLVTDVAGSGALLFALTGTELRSLDLSDPAAEEVRAD